MFRRRPRGSQANSNVRAERCSPAVAIVATAQPEDVWEVEQIVACRISDIVDGDAWGIYSATST